jgi:GMP synthase-like glutamine amidotransferase
VGDSTSVVSVKRNQLSAMTFALKVAVLLNGFESSYTPAIRASFESAIESASSKAGIARPSIDFYDPIVVQIHPDPTKYDLIVLSGGTADPMGSEPWVVKLQNYLRTTVKNHPKQKIVGICWGHQTISISFGGSVGRMEGAEIGVTNITLTPEGKKIFSFARGGCLRIHEFHRRNIKVPSSDFIPLAENNQVFVNNANTIMTFQGHPELNTELAKTLLANAPNYMGLDDAEIGVLAKSMESAHDGGQIWARILQWVNE